MPTLRRHARGKSCTWRPGACPGTRPRGHPARHACAARKHRRPVPEDAPATGWGKNRMGRWLPPVPVIQGRSCRAAAEFPDIRHSSVARRTVPGLKDETAHLSITVMDLICRFAPRPSRAGRRREAIVVHGRDPARRTGRPRAGRLRRAMPPRRSHALVTRWSWSLPWWLRSPSWKLPSQRRWRSASLPSRQPEPAARPRWRTSGPRS